MALRWLRRSFAVPANGGARKQLDRAASAAPSQANFGCGARSGCLAKYSRAKPSLFCGRRRGQRRKHEWSAPFRTRHDSPRRAPGYRTRPKSGREFPSRRSRGTSGSDSSPFPRTSWCPRGGDEGVVTCALLVAGKAPSRLIKSLSTPSRHGVMTSAGILWAGQGSAHGRHQLPPKRRPLNSTERTAG